MESTIVVEDDVIQACLTPKLANHTSPPKTSKLNSFQQQIKIQQQQKEKIANDLQQAIFSCLEKMIEEEKIANQENKELINEYQILLTESEQKSTKKSWIQLCQAVFQDIKQNQTLPSFLLLDTIQNGIDDQFHTNKCVFFLLMAFQATTQENRSRSIAGAFSLISFLPSTSYLVRALIFYFKVVSENECLFVQDFLKEIENCTEIIQSPRNVYLLCWKIWQVSQDERVLDICLKNVWMFFEASKEKSERISVENSFSVLEVTFTCVSLYWKRFKEEIMKDDGFERASECATKVFYLLNSITYPWPALSSTISQIRAQFVLFQIRHTLNFVSDTSLHPSTARINRLLNEIKNIHRIFAQEVDLFKREFGLYEEEEEQEQKALIYVHDSDKFTAVQYLQVGMYLSQMRNLKGAYHALDTGIRSLLSHSVHIHAPITALFEKFEVEFLNIQCRKGEFLQKYVACALAIASQHPKASRESMLKNCATLLENMVSSFSADSSRLQLSSIIDSSEMENLLIIVYSAIIDLNPKLSSYAEKVEVLLAKQPITSYDSD